MKKYAISVYLSEDNVQHHLSPMTYVQGLHMLQKMYNKYPVLQRICLVEYPTQNTVAYINGGTHWSEVLFTGLSAEESAECMRKFDSFVVAYESKVGTRLF